MTLARAVIAALSLVVLLETAVAPVRRASVVLLLAYLLAALGAVFAERFFPRLAHTYFAGGGLFGTGGLPLSDALGLGVLVSFLVRRVRAGYARKHSRDVRPGRRWPPLASLCASPWKTRFAGRARGTGRPSVSGTIVSGMGMGFLAAREREHLSRQQSLEKITGVLRFDRGLTESIRQALGELALAFDCEQACLAVRDDEVERLFVWKVRPNERESQRSETLPLSRSEAFLIDCLEVSMGWRTERRAVARDSVGTAAPASVFGTSRRFRTRCAKNSASLAAGRDDRSGRTARAGRVLLINANSGRSDFPRAICAGSNESCAR